MHVSHARELANQTIDLCHLSRPVKDCCYYQWYSVVLLVVLPLVLARAMDLSDPSQAAKEGYCYQ